MSCCVFAPCPSYLKKTLEEQQAHRRTPSTSSTGHPAAPSVRVTTHARASLSVKPTLPASSAASAVAGALEARRRSKSPHISTNAVSAGRVCGVECQRFYELFKAFAVHTLHDVAPRAPKQCIWQP